MFENNNILNSEIKFLKGVGLKKSALLASELNITKYKDLLYHFPFRYVDKTKLHLIKEIQANSTTIQLRGRIINKQILGSGKSLRLSADLQDSTGKVTLVWFKGINWISSKIILNKEYLIFGKPSLFGNTINITHPEIEEIETAGYELQSRLQPVYNSTEKLVAAGLNNRGFNKLIYTLLEQIYSSLYENLPSNLQQKYSLISHKEALRSIHFPKNYDEIGKAQLRLKYEELLFIQLLLVKQNIGRKQSIPGFKFLKIGDKFNEFYKKNLPFELTNAQKRVIKEIRKDFASGKQMNRLLQGDVGSGKTMVSLMCMLIAADNNFQSAIMAPTEILAQQHYQSICKFLKGLNVNVKLLTGSVSNVNRKTILEELANGSVDIMIGTHALIEPKVIFKNLGFVVIDEQHRFGVQQRAKLWDKAKSMPHVLVMTATPIPRTMAMTLYGDLDYSVIDELPPGRKAIETYHYNDSKRNALFGFMKKQIDEGRQVYIVYPLINESETLDLNDLNEGYNSISRAFPIPKYQLSVLHGQMKAKDKEFEMQRFKNKETQIMVATTVIEVGVDVPNATIMVIENSERFGLSQLHQLRGRVGRGTNQSFCFLMSSYKLSKEAKFRLETMVKTNDGFEIADADLKLRGPGDLQGTQQSGLLALKIADLAKDEQLLKKARNDAQEILSVDPNLDKPENISMKRFIREFKNNKTNWGIIS